MRSACVVVALCLSCAIARADDVRPPPPAPPPKVTNVVTKPPKLIQAQAPEYPPAALAADKEAKVKVRIHIDENGIVTAVDVLDPVGDGFDEAAVAAAMQYVFEPAEIDGKPGAIAVETTINFVIEHREVEPPPEVHAGTEVHEGPPNHAGPMKAPVTLQGVVVERGTRRKLAGVIVSVAELGPDGTAPPSGGAAGRARVPPVDGTAPPSGGAAGRARVPAVDGTAPPSGGAAGRARVPPVDGTAPPSGGAAGRARVPPVDGTAPPSGGAAGRARVPPVDAITGEDGTFFFHGLPPGNYQILAVDAKYDRFARPIVIGKREALEVRLWMRPRGGNPYETVLEGEREVLEVTKHTLQRQQFTSVPGTFGDPIRVIQTLPGLQRAPFGLGLLLVRGSNPDDTGIYLDGHEVPSLFHFLGGPSIFNAEMLESLSLYPGGFPGRFGRHHGGAVTLETRPTAADGIHGSAKVDFIDAGGYARAPITKDLSVAVAGRRSYIDAFLGFVLPEPKPGQQRIVTPVYYDYQGRLDYNLHADGRLSLFVIGSSDGLHVLNKDPDAATSTDLNSSVKFLRVIGAYERPLHGDLKLTLSPAWGRDTLSFSGAQAEASGPFTSLAIVNNTLSYRMRVAGKVSPRVHLDTGIDLLSRITTYQALVPYDDNLISNPGRRHPAEQVFRGSQELGMGAYIDLGIDATSKLKLVPSLRRRLVHPRRPVSRVDRSAAGRPLPDRRSLDAQGYVGRFSQPPQPESLDRRFGNPNVGLEHGYALRPRLRVEARSPVVDRQRDLLRRAPRPGDVHRRRHPERRWQYSYVNFVNAGTQLLLRPGGDHQARDQRALLRLAVVHVQPGAQKRVPTERWSATGFDQPHVMNAVASWKPGGGCELGARFQLASGRPDTPVIGATLQCRHGRYVPDRRPGALGPRCRRSTSSTPASRSDWLFDRWSLGALPRRHQRAEHAERRGDPVRLPVSVKSPITSFPILPTLGVKGTW